MEDEEDLYDCVYDDEEGGEIYEDLMKTEAIPPPVCNFTHHVPNCVTFFRNISLTFWETCVLEIKP